MTSTPDQPQDERLESSEQPTDPETSPAAGEEVSSPLLGEHDASAPILGEVSDAEPILPPPPVTAADVQPVQQSVAVAEEIAPAAPAAARRRSLREELVDAFRSGDRSAIADALERGARFVLATTVFLVPIVFDPRTIDAFNLTKLTTLWVLGIVTLALAWTASHLGGRRLSLPGGSRVLRFGLVILVVTAVATVFSPNRVLSVFGLYHRYEGLVSIALYVGLLALILLLFHRRPEALDDVATAVAAAGGIAAAYVVMQRLGFDITQWRQATGGAPRFPIGPLGNSAFTAAYLGIAAPFVVYRAAHAREFLRRAVWAGVLIVLLVGVWITGGRAGMLATAAGILAVPLFTSRIQPYRKVFLVLLAIVALTVTPIVFGDPTDPAETEVLRTGTAGYRAQIWSGSWRMFTNRPVLGWGPETFYGQYPHFRTPDEARRTGLAISDKPHNVYLGWATSTGIIGFAAYVLLFGTGLVLVARGGPKLDHSKRLLAAAFGAGLVAYLVQGVYSIDVPPLFVMPWIFVACIAVLLERRATADASEVEAPRKAIGRRTWVMPAIVGVVTLVLLTFGFGPLRADHAAWAGERRSSLGWSTDTMGLYEKAIALNPREAAYRGLAGSYLERVAGNKAAPFDEATALKRSASYYLQALELQPRNVYFMINAARVYARLGASNEEYFEVGDRYIGQAVTLDPLNPQMRDLYTDFLNKWQEERSGSARQETLQRARTQAGIAQQLRAGRVIR